MSDQARGPVLGIDTSAGIAVGVAAGGRVLARRWLGDSRLHVERVTPLIAEALAEAGIAATGLGMIIAGMGPGPFTGLRVGIASAQTLGTALGVPVRGVCSLDAVAAAVAEPPGEFCVISDARRGEVYWALYGADRARIGEPRVTPAQQVPDVAVTGPGAALTPELAGRALAGGPEQTDGGVLALVGPGLPEIGPEPLYLRHADANVPTSRKSTLVNRSGRVRLRGRP
ncbi:tRNA (adenosine(37)-N6)-threonylcarbamoyltransferase complex dimerization subunit type 1 TsaB [Naumannella huperziae]